MKLGKKPATFSAKDLRLANYLTALPPVPKQFGHESLIPSWGMLGNDQYGDCVFAGAAHETMLWNAERRAPVAFTDASVLRCYGEVTGFTPNDPSTDQGTDVRAALNYRRKTGMLDAHQQRHKIGAFVALEPGNHDHLFAALYLFGAVGIGIEFPSTAMGQFNAGKPWAVVRGASIEGRHYIPLVARRSNLVCVSWGKLQAITLAFYKKYCDEAYAILSSEMLASGKSLEGFDLKALKADLAALI